MDDAIHFARAFEPYHLGWAEDFIRRPDWQGYKKTTEATTTPIPVGEAICGLAKGFKNLIDRQAQAGQCPAGVVCLQVFFAGETKSR